MTGRVRLQDLTADQALEIEEAVGAPIDDWGSVPRGRLLPLILHTVNGGDLADYRKMTIGELADAVAFSEDDAGNAEGAS